MGDPPQKRGFSGKNRKNGTYGPVESFPKTDFLIPRIFYLTGDMTKVRWNDQLVTYFSDVSVWNQYKYIAFNIFSCRILIISRKMVIITGISHEDTNALSIYAILC